MLFITKTLYLIIIFLAKKTLDVENNVAQLCRNEFLWQISGQHSFAKLLGEI